MFEESTSEGTSSSPLSQSNNDRTNTLLQTLSLTKIKLRKISRFVRQYLFACGEGFGLSTKQIHLFPEKVLTDEQFTEKGILKYVSQIDQEDDFPC